MESPQSTGLFRVDTHRHSNHYNDKRQYCPGCKSQRSAAQFKDHPTYCSKCVLRGKVPA